jgi:hypothetical protein
MRGQHSLLLWLYEMTTDLGDELFVGASHMTTLLFVLLSTSAANL